METIVNIAERIKYLMTKSIFKKNISSILLCLICTSICGQTESQLRKYFEDNISTLDPIEGIYDVELKTIPRNSFRVYDADVITDNYQVFVYRDGNKFVRYNPKSGNTTGEYVRSGETNAYTLTIPIANEKIRVRTIL